MLLNLSFSKSKKPGEAVRLATELPTVQPQASDLLVAYLDQIGVEFAFGVPGGAIEPLYNALARSERRGGIRSVVARHEAGAAFMADGYARESGKIGFCCATSGPGATNLITGVACAYDNSIPMLVITGQPPLPSHGKRALQDSSCTGVNLVGMFEHCTRFNSMVSHVDQLESKLVNAIMRVGQEPFGPAHLSIPVDILRAPVSSAIPSYDLQARLMQAAGANAIDEASIDRLCEDLRQSRRVAILIGNGCDEAIGAIVTLAEAIGAILITTPDGKGLINPEHRLYRGVFGFAGHYAARHALDKDDIDLILAVGTTLGEWTSSGWCDSVLNERMVHIDSSQEHLLRSPMARLHMHGRILSIFERLLTHMRQAPEALPKAELISEAGTVPYLEALETDAKDKPIKPQRLMFELGRRCPPATRFLADAGNSAAWAIHWLELHDRRMLKERRMRVQAMQPDHAPRKERRTHRSGWLRVTMDFAPMGWAIGASVGTAMANPRCPVVCITGDGSFLMNGQEITVAQAQGATVLFVILNDGALGMVKHGQRLAGAERIGYELPEVDYRRMAEAMGIPAYVIHCAEDLDCLDMKAILRRKGPTLLDVRIDGEEIPPMNLRMQALGTTK
ncbi:MAG: thiamine pyrophosphate-binding protein [Sulfuricella sp.]